MPRARTPPRSDPLQPLAPHGLHNLQPLSLESWRVQERGLEIVRLLLAAGANPSAQDDGGMSALHCAAMQGRDNIVTALLDATADTGARMGRESAYHCALDAGHSELAERLAQVGCPTDRA